MFRTNIGVSVCLIGIKQMFYANQNTCLGLQLGRRWTTFETHAYQMSFYNKDHIFLKILQPLLYWIGGRSPVVDLMLRMAPQVLENNLCKLFLLTSLGLATSVYFMLSFLFFLAGALILFSFFFVSFLFPFASSWFPFTLQYCEWISVRAAGWDVS